MTGLPRNSGWSRCSTGAKNASRSTWRIVRWACSLSSTRCGSLCRRRCRAAVSSRSPSPSSSASPSPGSSAAASVGPGLAVLFAVPGWVLVRRVAPDLPAPGAVGVAIVDQRLPVGAPRRPRRPRHRLRPAGGASRDAAGHPGRPSSPGSATRGWRRCAARRPPGSAHRSARMRPPGSSPPCRLLVGFVLFANGWRETARRLGLGRLELERPARPRRDRFEHPPRQLPARGALLRRAPLTYHWFADFHGAIASSAARRRPHPGLLRDERAVRRRMALLVWALALRLTGRPPGRGHRDDPGLPRRRDGLAPAGR